MAKTTKSSATRKSAKARDSIEKAKERLSLDDVQNVLTRLLVNRFTAVLKPVSPTLGMCSHLVLRSAAAAFDPLAVNVVMHSVSLCA
jgi:hypothetical protein